MGTATCTLLTGANSEGPVTRMGPGHDHREVIFKIVPSASYATGGETIALPADAKLGDIVAIELITRHDGTRIWEWNGSTTAPKVIAYDAFATQEGNATDVSAVTLIARAILT